jgi:glycosyltransferase involved in cell wall biosynthesis
MTVSILIPVYNEENTIAAVLQLLHEASLPATVVEIIIIDDGSTDSTSRILSKYSNIV